MCRVCRFPDAELFWLSSFLISLYFLRPFHVSFSFPSPLFHFPECHRFCLLLSMSLSSSHISPYAFSCIHFIIRVPFSGLPSTYPCQWEEVATGEWEQRNQTSHLKPALLLRRSNQGLWRMTACRLACSMFQVARLLSVACCCEDIAAEGWAAPPQSKNFLRIKERAVTSWMTVRNLRHWKPGVECGLWFVLSPWTWLISELEERISSASFWAVGSTSVWWAVIRYCTSFCSWSLFIWNKVSEIGSRSFTCNKHKWVSSVSTACYYCRVF